MATLPNQTNPRAVTHAANRIWTGCRTKNPFLNPDDNDLPPKHSRGDNLAPALPTQEVPSRRLMLHHTM